MSGTLAIGGTTFVCAAGEGARFPAPAAGDYFLMTLFELDVGGNETKLEVVKVTTRTGDSFTIVRDVESMTGNAGGYSYAGGATVCYAQMRVTAKTLTDMAQNADAHFTGPVTMTDDLTVGNSAGVNVNLKAGTAGTTGAINWTLNTASTVYGSISLPYDTRTTVGLKFESEASYPITFNSGNGYNFQGDGVTHSYIADSGNWYMGAGAQPAGFTVAGLNLIGKDTFFHLSMSRTTDDINSPAIYLNKSRGSYASPTSPILNDGIGSIFFQVYNAAAGATQPAAAILGIVDGEVGTSADSSDAPGALSFRTTGDGTSTPTERLRISSTGLATFSGDAAFAGNRIDKQAAPTAVNTTSTLGTAALLGRLLTTAPAGAVNLTLPTGTLMDAALGISTDQAVEWAVVNTNGTNTSTILAGTGHTVVGNMAVGPNVSAMFRTRKTAANTFITYRVS